MGTTEKILSKHKRGQWYKKVHGKVYYFGTDYDKAVEQWLAAKDHILAGLGKPSDSEDPKLYQLANLYYAVNLERIKIGEFSERSLKDSDKTIKKLIGIIGRDSTPGTWVPSHFQHIKVELFKLVPRKKGTGGRSPSTGRRAHSTVNGDIRRIKAFLNWCHDSKHIPKPDFGKDFSESSGRVTRLERNKSQSGSLDRESILAIITACNPRFLPVVMLGINCGMGARDIASLRLDQFDGSEWLDCPRLKTGAPRRSWLWPETRQAIAAYLETRKESYLTAHRSIAFLTKQRCPWVTLAKDSAAQTFKKTKVRAGIERGTFYDLRRTFQTVGDETLDFPAVMFCMGHLPPSSDMSAKYRDVSDERVRRVCSYVRDWLYANHS